MQRLFGHKGRIARFDLEAQRLHPLDGLLVEAVVAVGPATLTHQLLALAVDAGEHRAVGNQLAKKHGLRMIPTGDAVQLFRERLPVDYGKVLTRAELAAIPRPSTVDFHGDVTGSSAWKKGTKGSQKDWEEVKLRIDSAHLNPRGQYLQACVWLGFLFKTDPTAFSHRPKDLSESDAKLMRQCARDALR